MPVELLAASAGGQTGNALMVFGLGFGFVFAVLFLLYLTLKLLGVVAKKVEKKKTS